MYHSTCVGHLVVVSFLESFDPSMHRSAYVEPYMLVRSFVFHTRFVSLLFSSRRACMRATRCLRVYRVCMGSSVFHGLLGIAIGHLFYFLVDVLPDLHDIDLLRTPKIFVDVLGWGQEGSGVSMQAPGGGGGAGASGMAAPGNVRPPRDIPRTGRGAGWGFGRTLGSS